MAKNKPKSPTKKPGPEAEVHRIEGDPIKAFDRMVRVPPPKPARKRRGK